VRLTVKLFNLTEARLQLPLLGAERGNVWAERFDAKPFGVSLACRCCFCISAGASVRPLHARMLAEIDAHLGGSVMDARSALAAALPAVTFAMKAVAEIVDRAEMGPLDPAGLQGVGPFSA
jgi:hypothetical protein